MTPRAPVDFSAHPLFWLAAALAAGIAAARLTGVGWPLALGFGAVTAAGAAVCVWRRESLAVWALLLAFVGAGATLAALEQRNDANANRVRRLYEAGLVPEGAPVELTGWLNDAPERAPDGYYLLLRVESLRFRGAEHATGGLVALFAPARDAAQRAAYAGLGLRYGARLRVAVRLEFVEPFRNPGVSSRNEYLEQRGYEASAAVKSPLLVERLGDAPVWLPRAWLHDWRQSLADRIAATFNLETAGVLQASLLGLRHSLTRDVAERFRTGGTFHVLVISGLHVTFIGGVVWWLTRRATRRRGLQCALSVSLIWVYTLLVGAEASVVRAALMFTLAATAPVLRREAWSLNTLGGAALALLVWRPKDLFDPSFQLTFLAVFAIVGLAWPVWQKLAEAGRWHPTSAAPVPPGGPRVWLTLGEILFWSERNWQRELARAAYDCRLRKSPWAARLERWRVQGALRWVAGAVWVSLSVQVVMLPLAVLYFHRVSWASLVLNLFVGALMAALSLVSLAALVFAPLAKLAHALNWLMVHSVDPFAALGAASWRVAEYGGWKAVVYGLYFAPVCGLAAWAWRWNPFNLEFEISDLRFQKLAQAAGVFLFILAGVIVFHPFSAPADGRLHVCFIDVGQGDAALLVMPDGATVLVDGGGRIRFGRKPQGETDDADEVFVRDTRGVGEAAVAEFLWQRGLDSLDYIVASHADADHIEGLNEVAQNFAVRAALAGRAPPDDPDFAAFARTLRERNVPLKVIGRGDTLRFGDVTVETLWPLPASDPNAPSSNNDSIVWRVRYGQRAFLFTGDIEAAAEATLAQQPETLRADVVKAPHHGSKTSSTQEFINAVRPAFVVASVGLDSTFGHPHAEVVERWRQSGAQFWTTGQKGLIEFTTNGQDLRVETFVP
jgi:competence protein ComEC